MTDDEDRPQVSLEDLLKMLTLGRSTIMEKAVAICKFQRGLDNSTFTDRFNFQVFEQLSEWFGTEQYERWDEENCPAPIKLTRIKNQFQHAGFLDIDAIHCIQDYLKIRYKKTGRIIQKGEPLFIKNFLNPIKDTHELISKSQKFFIEISEYEQRLGSKLSKHQKIKINDSVVDLGKLLPYIKNKINLLKI